jgi:CRISPR-associated RAMP protein (TIGR02581 family)
LLNEAFFTLTLRPEGPILIKSGQEDADPTRPDMSFVRTVRNGRPTVYLPGSSLKGVLRAHSERLARTVDSPEREKDAKAPLACDPLSSNASCSRKLEPRGREGREEGTLSGAEKYRRSCFLCQLFGSTGVASRFRLEDAYSEEEVRTEERNGVAIDRIYGSVAVGPFNYETAITGEFRTRIHLKNYTLAQLGLLALTLRDVAAGRVRLGFGKSRGLGVVALRMEAVTLRYPLGELADGQLRVPDGRRLDATRLYGVGSLLGGANDYGFPAEDDVSLPEGWRYVADDWLGVELSVPVGAGGEADWQTLGRACVPRWRAVVQNVH